MSEIDIEKELKKILTQAYQIPVNVLAFIHLLHKEWQEQKQRIAELERDYEASQNCIESLISRTMEKDKEIERLKDYEKSRVAANKPLKDKS